MPPVDEELYVDSNVAAYLSRYPREVTFGQDDAGTVFDRYHTPDFVMCNDGVQLDREKLLAHVRPARRRARDVRVDVHETLSTADRVAARYTLAADMADDFKEFGVASLSIWMGILLTERLKNIVAGAPDKFGGMLEIARATKDAELRTAATAFARSQKASCQVLADELAGFAVKIATA